MQPQEYSRLISSYIDLNTIKDVLLSYDNNKQQVLEKSVSLLGSSVIKEPSDWDLLPLICDYLEHFRVAEESIDLLLKLEPKGSFSDEAINWLRNYRFSGQVRHKYNLGIDVSNYPFEPLIGVISESGIIDILHIPLNFLMSTIEQFSYTWNKVKEMGGRVFLEPSSPSELFIYIEKRVAMQYEHLDKNRPGEFSGTSIINGYRYSCMTFDIPVNIDFINTSIEASKMQANSTLN